MEEEVVSDSSSDNGGGGAKASSPLFLSSFFETECPRYMAMGMSYDEFWYGDPTLTIVYRKAFELTQEERNTEAWIQGAYFYQAFLAIAPAMSSMGKAKPQPYLDKPFELHFDGQTESKEEHMERVKYEQAQAHMEAYAKRINAARGEEHVSNQP